MSTLQEQLEQSITKYNENAEKIHAFINGTDSESIESVSGNKPTIAKIVTDTQNQVNNVTSGITMKASQVASDRVAVENVKTDLEDSLISINKKYAGGVGAEVGSIVAFPVNNLPQGYLVCDGSVVQKSVYPDLVRFLTENDSATQATLPDLRGVFVRGWDNGKGLDSNRVLGSYQEDEFKSHNHDIAVKYHDLGGWGGIDSSASDPASTKRTEYRGGTETRPKNIALIYAIKAFGKVVTNGAIDLNGLSQNVQENTSQLESLPKMKIGSVTTGSGGTNPKFFVNKNSFFSSVSRIATGFYRFYYSIAQPDNNYTIFVTIDWGTSWGAFKVNNQSTTYFDVGLLSGNAGTGINLTNAKIHLLIVR